MNLISKKIKIFFFFLLSVFAFSQTLSSNLSKNKIALGEKATIRISINNLQGKDVISAPKNQLLPFHFEVTKDVIDKNFDQYTRTVEFQIFDEGTFKIPELEFSVNGVDVKKTIPYEITVYNPVNADDQINDIMNNKQVDLGFRDYWEMYKFYVLGVLALVISTFIFFKFIKNGFFNKNKIQKTPTHKTLQDLENLRKKKYIETGNYRLFYVEIIDISREFLAKQYRIPADVLLTDDLIDVMKHTNRISTENEKVVEEIFLRGDLVKFAKIFPNQEMMERDYQKIYEFVKSSTVEIEEQQLRDIH